jgi:hypothetical protein
MTTMAVVADSDGYFGQHLFGVGAALLTRRSHKTNPLINLRFVFVRGAFWTAVGKYMKKWEDRPIKLS